MHMSCIPILVPPNQIAARREVGWPPNTTPRSSDSLNGGTAACSFGCLPHFVAQQNYNTADTLITSKSGMQSSWQLDYLQLL